MDEPPASWDQQDDEINTSVSTAASTLSTLNVNASEFVPSFGSGLSLSSKVPHIPTPPVPKTPPSTPVVHRNATNENDSKIQVAQSTIDTTPINLSTKTVSDTIVSNESEHNEQVVEDESPDEDEIGQYLFDQEYSLTKLFFSTIMFRNNR